MLARFTLRLHQVWNLMEKYSVQSRLFPSHDWANESKLVMKDEIFLPLAESREYIEYLGVDGGPIGLIR